MQVSHVGDEIAKFPDSGELLLVLLIVTERGVKAIGRQNGGLFKVHEGNFDMFYCFLFILITEILK